MRELLRAPVSDLLKGNLETAIALMNHDVIDAEDQLKNVVKTLKTSKTEVN